MEPDGTLPIYWNVTSFGVSQEAFVTLKTVDAAGVEQDLLLKVQKGPNATAPDYSKGVIEVDYLAQTKKVRVAALRPNKSWTNYPPITAEFKNGDQLGARVYGTGPNAGMVYIYRTGKEVGKVKLNDADQAFFNTKGGHIGLWFISSRNAYFDDFGGGNL